MKTGQLATAREAEGQIITHSPAAYANHTPPVARKTALLHLLWRGGVGERGVHLEDKRPHSRDAA